MLLRQKGSPSIKGLHLEYMRGRWEEHRLESEIRAGRDPTEKQKLLLSVKRLRMEAEIACYNDVILSTSPGTLSITSCFQDVELITSQDLHHTPFMKVMTLGRMDTKPMTWSSFNARNHVRAILYKLVR